MNGFVSLINALAWPLATLAIAILFQRELRMALGRLGQVKYAGMEVNFHEDLHQAETLARSVGRLDTPPAAAPAAKVHLEVAASDTSELAGAMVDREVSTATTVLVAAGSKAEPKSRRNLDAYLKVCDGSPRVGVLEVWDDLSQALIQAANRLGDRRAVATARVESAVRFLVERGWMSSQEGELVDRLRRLSDLVEQGHGSPLTVDDARRFAGLVVPLMHRVIALI